MVGLAHISPAGSPCQEYKLHLAAVDHPGQPENQLGEDDTVLCGRLLFCKIRLNFVDPAVSGHVSELFARSYYRWP